jgi:hypothetical protein
MLEIAKHGIGVKHTNLWDIHPDNLIEHNSHLKEAMTEKPRSKNRYLWLYILFLRGYEGYYDQDDNKIV